MSMIWIFAAFAVAFVSVLWLHPRMVKIAREKGITDKPNRRKLQREPIPVLGGVAVFFGIVTGVGCTLNFTDSEGFVIILALLTLMLYTGTMDDIIGLTPRFRFFIEFLAAMAAILIWGYSINDFHGLWGVNALSEWVGIPLTVIAIIGIINAINLIDGVDGLSSGYCIMACFVFGCYFLLSGDVMMSILATACIGALIPFFLHNVFGKRSKMFIGDGGTLLMGMIMSLFVLRVLYNGSEFVLPECADCKFGLVPFTLAVLAIPVFDTVRVMTTRIIRHTSPFSPDKKHLHHAFIELGFSHFATTMSILCLNLLIVAGWFGLYKCGCSTDIQFWFVVVTGLLFTAGIYFAAQAKTNKSAKVE